MALFKQSSNLSAALLSVTLLTSSEAFALPVMPPVCVEPAFLTFEMNEQLQATPIAESHACRLEYTLTDKLTSQVVYRRGVDYPVIGKKRQAVEKAFWGVAIPVLFTVDAGLSVAVAALGGMTGQNPITNIEDQMTDGTAQISIQTYRLVADYCRPADRSPESPTKRFAKEVEEDQFRLRNFDRACVSDEGRLWGVGPRVPGAQRTVR